MKKIKKIIGVIGIAITLILLLWLAFRESANKKENTNNILPTPTEIDDGDYELIDGATEETYNEQEQKIYDQMGNLRDKMPIQNDQFNLFFNYDINKFVVSYKNGETNNFNILKEWLVNNNFGEIPMTNFLVGETI